MGLEGVNWIAVIVGVVASFLFGWLVYSPIAFGKKWAEGSGVELTDRPPPFPMIAQVLALLFLATVIGITATADALIAAILAIIATAAFVISNGAFCRKTTYALTVDGGYIVGSGIIMILAQGIF